MVPKHGGENNKRPVEATEMDALRRSSRISRKERIRNVSIRQQTGEVLNKFLHNLMQYQREGIIMH